MEGKIKMLDARDLTSIDTYIHAVVYMLMWGWTVMSWFLGFYGIIQIIRLFIMAIRGRVVERRGEPVVEFGNIDVKELSGAILCLGILAAWFYMC